MKNTKKLVAILVAVLMVVACVFVLVACQKHECESKCPECGKCTNKDCTEEACKDKCQGHVDTSKLPTEEGKVTLFWNVVNSVELTEIASYFLIGGPNSWEQGNTDYELQRLGTSSTYYVLMETAKATGAEYKVVIGYNSKSPVEPSAQGPFWANEGYGSKTWAAGGANSAVPEFTGSTVDCGTIEFDGCLGDPVPVTNFDVKVSFVKGQLDTSKAVVYIMGHFSSWANTPNDAKIKAVLDTSSENAANLDVYKIHVDQMYAKEDAEYLVLVFPEGLGEEITKAEGTVEVWDYFNREGSGAIKIGVGAKADNAKIEVTDLYTNDYMEIANTISQGSTARGLDLTKKVENTKEVPKEGGEEGETDTVPAGNYSLNMNTILPAVNVTLKVEFTGAIPADMNVYLAGTGFDGMDWNDSTLKFTASADRKTFTLELTEIPIGTVLECKIVVFGTTGDFWDVNFGVGGEPGAGNMFVTIEGAGEISLFEAALTYPVPEE